MLLEAISIVSIFIISHQLVMVQSSTLLPLSQLECQLKSTSEEIVLLVEDALCTPAISRMMSRSVINALFLKVPVLRKVPKLQQVLSFHQAV